jgi:hypothetical protein
MSDVYNKITTDGSPNIEYSVEDIFLGSSNMKMILFEKRGQKYQPQDGIRVSISHTKRESEKEEFNYHTYVIELKADNNEFRNIEKYAKSCLEIYNDEQLSTLKNQHIFVLSSVSTSNNKYDTDFQELPFDTTKTFDNMFFENKESIKAYVDYFLENKNRYMRIGKPYKIGFLLWGSPGTGKTSFIKALAKYTNRHIVVIPIKKIRSMDALKAIFLNPNINDVFVPNKKRLYVIEDIDCGQWKNVVMSREFLSASATATSTPTPSLHTSTHIENVVESAVEKVLLSASANATKPKNKPTVEEELDLNLADLLDILDGVVENPDRMIVATTNHPEVLDPALLRPGRFDKVIEFKKMRRCDIQKMYALWFSEEMPPDLLEPIADYQYSQAEIGIMFEEILAKRDL